MATSTNKGEQEISFKFKTPAAAETFNKVNHKLHKPGIYDWQNRDSGGTLLTKVDDSTVEVNPLVAVVSANNAELSVRMETTLGHQLSVSSTLPYVVLRYAWSNAEANYVDIVSTDFVNIQTTDVIVGRTIYDGATMLTEFDYSRTTLSPLDREAEDKTTAFTVTPTEPVSKRVFVSEGKMRTEAGIVVGGNMESPDVSDCGSSGRHDLVWIDKNGDVQIAEGAAGVAPDYDTKLVVAEIQRNEASSEVTGDDIVPVYDYRLNFDRGADMIGVADVAGRLSSDNVEDALLEFHTATEFISTANGEGASLVGIEDSRGLYDATTVEGALEEALTLPRTVYNSDNGKTYTAKMVFRDLEGIDWTFTHNDFIDSLAISPDSLTLYFGSNSEVRALDVRNQTDSLIYSASSDPDAMVVSPDGSTIYFGESTNIRSVTISTGTLNWTNSDHTSSIRQLAVSPDGSQLFAAGGDGVLSAIDTSNGNRQWSEDQSDSQIRGVVVSKDGNTLFSLGSSGQLTDYALPSGTLGNNFGYLGAPFGTVLAASSPSGHRTYVAYENDVREFLSFERDDGWVLPQQGNSGKEAYSLKSSPDGEKLYMANGNGQVREIDARGGTWGWVAQLATPHPSNEIVWNIEVSPNGESVYAQISDSIYRIKLRGEIRYDEQ